MIKAKRQSLNMTQFDLAKLLGVSRSTVAMWENGTNTPPTNILIKLADLFGCTIDELVRG